MNLTPNDKLKLEGALKDMSTSMTRVEAERDLQKNVIGDICEELNLNKKVFRKLAKVYHKQNFDDEVNTHQEFEKLYETVTRKTIWYLNKKLPYKDKKSHLLIPYFRIGNGTKF